MKPANAERNARILELAGKKSFGVIARELRISRHAVAGVVWRAKWPAETRVYAPFGTGGGKCGNGRMGGRQTPAPETVWGPRC